jgi:hypothetical protein
LLDCAWLRSLQLRPYEGEVKDRCDEVEQYQQDDPKNFVTASILEGFGRCGGCVENAIQEKKRQNEGRQDEHFDHYPREREEERTAIMSGPLVDYQSDRTRERRQLNVSKLLGMIHDLTCS